MKDLVKIRIVKNIENYDPRPVDNTYYGVIFDEDEEHIRVKCFSTTYSAKTVYFGTMNRFIKDDVEIIHYNEELCNFI
jgi:hypothetical protein